MTMLEKDAVLQYTVKAITSFHFYFLCLLVLMLFYYMV